MKELEETYFAYVGRLEEIKGIRILFEAWKQMGSQVPKLVVCGNGPMEDWCREFICENGLAMIEMRGFVPNDEAKRLIANSKALIMPTQWYEGFPMTILEAYSGGVPVLGSAIGNVGHVIQEGITGWKFIHNSINSLIEAICIAEKAILTVNKVQIEQYTKENNYRILTGIYEKVCTK